MTEEQQLRVWWIPQVPMKAFYVEVKDIAEAKKIIDVLGQYDMFQYKNNIKPDYCNVGGLEVWIEDLYEEGCSGWTEWENENGYTIEDVNVNGIELEK